MQQPPELGDTAYTYPSTMLRASGLRRISQQAGSTAEYCLGDALGSVHRWADAAG